MTKAPRHTEIAAQSHVASMLARCGWLPAQADYLGVRANNFDLFAAKGTKRIAIQVKGSSLQQGKKLQLGYNNPEKAFFNRKLGPRADFVIAVAVFKDIRKPCTAYIMPAAVAQRLARRNAEHWSRRPKRDGQERAQQFPIWLPAKDLARYREAWHLLDKAAKRFH